MQRGELFILSAPSPEFETPLQQIGHRELKVGGGSHPHVAAAAIDGGTAVGRERGAHAGAQRAQDNSELHNSWTV